MTGKTIWDFMAPLGKWGAVAIALTIIVLWGLIHFLADPGTEISYLGIKYTKADNIPEPEAKPDVIPAIQQNDERLLPEAPNPSDIDWPLEIATMKLLFEKIDFQLSIRDNCISISIETVDESALVFDPREDVVQVRLGRRVNIAGPVNEVFAKNLTSDREIFGYLGASDMNSELISEVNASMLHYRRLCREYFPLDIQ